MTVLPTVIYQRINGGISLLESKVLNLDFLFPLNAAASHIVMLHVVCTSWAMRCLQGQICVFSRRRSTVVKRVPPKPTHARKCCVGGTFYFWLARGSVDARGELWACLRTVMDKTHGAPCRDLGTAPCLWGGELHPKALWRFKQGRSQLIHSSRELKPW